MDFWATETYTVWEIGSTDDNGDQSYSAPTTVKGTHKTGGKIKRDSSGNEFVPRSTFMLLSEVKKSQLIAIGDLTANPTPPVTAERIRAVGEYAPQPFAGRSLPVYEAYTE